MPDLNEIAKVQKNNSTQVVFSLTEYNNEQYVDIREYVDSEAYRGFTRKGIRFHNRLVDEFIEALGQVRTALGEVESPEEQGPAEEQGS